MKKKIIYGVPMEHSNSEAIVEELVKLNVTGVFGGYKNRRFVELAHQNGIKVYASFGCFKGKTLWDEIPDCRPILPDQTQFQVYGNYYGVNPTHPTVRQQRLQEFENILRTYDIDRIWLDFIRWPCKWEAKDPEIVDTSYDKETIRRFAEANHLPNTPTVIEEHYETWIQWKQEVIHTWVTEAREIQKRIRPDISLGLFSVPWTQEDYDNAVIRVLGQDVRALSKQVDIISPMVYHKLCYKGTEWIEGTIEKIGQKIGRNVLPIIQSVDKPASLSEKEYKKSLAVCLENASSEGVMIFKLEALQGNKEKITADMFKQYT